MTVFRYVNAKKDLTTNSATDIYTCPAVFSLYKTKAISANATAELLTHSGIYMTAGEKISATAATANRLHIIISVRESFVGTN